MNKRYLYYIAGLIWGMPGIMVTIKGIHAYATIPTRELWWLGMITVGVLVGFTLMFSRIVTRYCTLIAAEPEETSVWHTFPVRGWVLVICMSCLGMALKFVPFIPAEFTASFYSGLGPALVIAAIRFSLHPQKW